MPVGEGHNETRMVGETCCRIVAEIESAVNFPWALCVAREDAASLASLRLMPGIEVGDAGFTIWLRGQHCDEKFDVALSALPARSRYEWLASNQLRQINERIPSR